MDFWAICRSVSGGGCRAATARRPSTGGVSRRRPPGGASSLISRSGSGEAFFAPLRGASDEPPSAAEIAGSRPGGRADFLRAQEVGGRRALKGGFKRPARATPGARYARRPLKGPRRPFGTRFEPPTAESFVRKRGAKLAPLENPPTAHAQPTATIRQLPKHPPRWHTAGNDIIQRKEKGRGAIASRPFSFLFHTPAYAGEVRSPGSGGAAIPGGFPRFCFSVVSRILS